ncbi:hypothetical protein PT2222_180193 [Paraburkholderia tropica]
MQFMLNSFLMLDFLTQRVLLYHNMSN